MAAKYSIQVIPATTFDSIKLTSKYKPINVDGIPNPCFKLRISNLTGSEITISFDGITDNDVITAGQCLDLDGNFGSSQLNSTPSFWEKGTILYVRGNATIGSLVLSGYYQNQGA